MNELIIIKKRKSALETMQEMLCDNQRKLADCCTDSGVVKASKRYEYQKTFNLVEEIKAGIDSYSKLFNL